MQDRGWAATSQVTFDFPQFSRTATFTEARSKKVFLSRYPEQQDLGAEGRLSPV